MSDATHPPDDPVELNNARIFVWVTVTLVLVLSILSFAARIWARKKLRQPLLADDWFMALGLLISFLPAACIYLSLFNGLGVHIWNVPPDQRLRFQKLSFALQRANAPSLFAIKTSILLFYMRVFATQKFKRAAWLMIGITGAWAIAAFVSNLLLCTPVSFFYDKNQPGFCRDQTPSGISNGTLSFVGDIIILALPIPVIWKLKIDMRRKIALVGIFLLGGLVCIISILRVTALARLDVKDITYSQVYPSSLTYIEMGVGVLSGNLPLLRPLFRPFFGTGSTNVSRNTGLSSQARSKKLSRISRGYPPHHIALDTDGFERIIEPNSESSDTRRTDHASDLDIELADRSRSLGGIVVKTDLRVESQQLDVHAISRDQEEKGMRTIVSGLTSH